MKITRRLLLAFTLLLTLRTLGAATPAQAAASAATPSAPVVKTQPAPGKSLRVLFIGNSYTYVNDLPELVKRLLAARGVQLDLEKVVVGGATLERHWKEGKAQAAIHKRPWDYVVLQEQSSRPFRDREAMFRDARLFHAEIRKTGAKTVLYETWAAKIAPAEQPKLTDAYETLGRELGAIVVPAGEAWKRALAQGIELHGKDGRHPNLRGSFLAACAFVRILDGQKTTPTASIEIGKGAAALTAKQMEALQRIADQTLKEQKTRTVKKPL